MIDLLLRIELLGGGVDTVSIEIDGVGLREISEKALRHMALYRANADNKNFKHRVCHDFAETFHIDDVLEDEFIGRRAGRSVLSSVFSRDISFELSPPELNGAIALPAEDYFSPGSVHSQITASRYSKDQDQLFISKFDERPVYLHTLQSACDVYQSASSDYYRKYISVRSLSLLMK